MIDYKVYRNKLCALIRLSKQKYYDILSRNSKNTNPIQFLKDPNNNH